MRAEAELVLCSVQSGAQTGSADDRLARLLQNGLDWETVANLATRNGVLPLMYSRLKELVGRRGLPPLPEHLKTLFHVNAVRSQHMTAELLRLLKLLDEQGVNAIPFKGPSLAALIHGDTTMRQFVDLDLFVRRSNLALMVDVLLAAGYQTRFDCRDTVRTSLFNAHENEFISTKSRITLDVHWGITPDSLPFGPSIERLWGRARQTHVNGKPVRTLAPVDQVHVLCLQGCRDGWDKLSSVCGIAGLIKLIADDSEWTLLIEEAKECRTFRMVLLGLCIANHWLNAPLPPAIDKLVNADGTITSLAQRIGLGFFTCGNMRRMAQEWIAQLVVPVAVIETRRDRWRFYFVRFLQPTLRDGEFVQLPRSLFALYYVLRPVRLLVAAASWVVERLRRFAIQRWLSRPTP
jgi:hypothetical protein